MIHLLHLIKLLSDECVYNASIAHVLLIYRRIYTFYEYNETRHFHAACQSQSARGEPDATQDQKTVSSGPGESSQQIAHRYRNCFFIQENMSQAKALDSNLYKRV